MSEPSKRANSQPQGKDRDAAEAGETAQEENPEEKPEPPVNRYGYDRNLWPESK